MMLELLLLLGLVVVGTLALFLTVMVCIYGGAWLEWLIECFIAWVAREQPPRMPSAYPTNCAEGEE